MTETQRQIETAAGSKTAITATTTTTAAGSSSTTTSSTMTTLNRLVSWFLLQHQQQHYHQNNGDSSTSRSRRRRRSRMRAIVALSGGVDSAVVALAAAKALGSGALAITADYKTLADEELATAKQVANEVGIAHKVIEYNELENPQFVKNDPLRCYHCRSELGRHLIQEAKKSGIKLIVDGTNIDDLVDYRPGIRALRENGIRSPLVELGIGKSEIRAIAKQFGLSVFDKPSNACLASRIPTGTTVTYEKLRKIESSEMIVKSIFDVRQVRVRDHGDIARIEVGRSELAKMFDIDKLTLLDAKLKELGFKFVTIDVAGYKTGNVTVIGGIGGGGVSDNNNNHADGHGGNPGDRKKHG